MSDGTCQAGTINGFPLKLAQQLSSAWPSTSIDQVASGLQSITGPCDYSIAWGPPESPNIRVTKVASTYFRINGFTNTSSTLSYGGSQYTCSDQISIVKVQHAKLLTNSQVGYEMILAFQISDKTRNPSAPHVILMCRPIIAIDSGTDSLPFLTAVNTAAKRGAAVNTQFDMSKLYGYGNTNKDLLPTIVYESCLNASTLTPPKSGNIRVRVNVCTQPLYIKSDPAGISGLCNNISNYTFITTPGLKALLNSSSTGFQFTGTTAAISGTESKYIAPQMNTAISAFSNITSKLQIQVPKAFLGQSLTQITNATDVPLSTNEKKQMKCYRIDPAKDIINNRILVDPRTGASLQDTMTQEAQASAGDDPELAAALANGGAVAANTSGLMPGDIQNILVSIVSIFLIICLLAYSGLIFKRISLKDFTNAFRHGVVFIISLTLLALFIVFEDNKVAFPTLLVLLFLFSSYICYNLANNLSE